MPIVVRPPVRSIVNIFRVLFYMLRAMYIQYELFLEAGIDLHIYRVGVSVSISVSSACRDVSH
jgi:hypothetical protein